MRERQKREEMREFGTSEKQKIRLTAQLQPAMRFFRFSWMDSITLYYKFDTPDILWKANFGCVCEKESSVTIQQQVYIYISIYILYHPVSEHTYHTGGE